MTGCGLGSNVVRILIADDSSQLRHVLRNLVEQDANWEVCGEAVNGGDAVQIAKATNPDLILPDFQMPVMNGLQAAHEISKVITDVPVLLCTGHLTPHLIGEARRVGISGVVSKSRASDIINGIKALLRHESYFCMQV